MWHTLTQGELTLIPDDPAVRRRVAVLAELLFLACFALYSFDMWMRLTMFREYADGAPKLRLDEVVWRVFVICIALKLLSQRYTPLQLACLAVVGACLWHVRLVCGDRLLFMTFCLFAAGQDMRLRPVAFVALVTLVVVIVFAVGGHRLGLWAEYTVPRADRVRHSLGFGHPNSLARALALTLFAWVIVRGRRGGLGEALATVPLMLFVDQVTDSRTTVLMLVLMLVLVAYYRLCVRGEGSSRVGVALTRVLAVVFVAFFVAAFLWTLWAMREYANGLPRLQELDHLLSGRLRHQSAYYQIEGGLRLWGFDFGSLEAWQNSTVLQMSDSYLLKFNLDNSYAYILLCMGCFSAAVVCAAGLLVAGAALREGGGALTLVALLYFALESASEYILPIGAYVYVLPLAAAAAFYGMPLADFESEESALMGFGPYRWMVGGGSAL